MSEQVRLSEQAVLLAWDDDPCEACLLALADQLAHANLLALVHLRGPSGELLEPPCSEAPHLV